MEEELLRLRTLADSALDSAERSKYELLRQRGQAALDSVSKDSGKNRLRQLLHKLGCSLLVPDLTTKLSAEEERVRAALTYQSFDRMLWVAAFSDLEELSEKVIAPKKFRDSVENLVCLFSDQIPLWVKSGQERELFASWERQPCSQAELRHNLEVAHQASLEQRGKSLPSFEAAKPSAKAKASSGQGQKRALKEDQHSRYRITYEARQALYGLCTSKPQAQLSGAVLPGLIVVHGVHARLSNIDSSGRFIVEESFSWKGKQVVRSAKSYAGKILLSWRQARDKDPLLFEQVSVMSQPSANVDSIIFKWSQEELAKVSVVALHQRDAFAGAWTTSATESLYASNHLQCLLAPKLTASLQLTDTDYARSFKALCRAEMESFRSSGQQALLAQGSREPWQASPLDMVKAIVSAQTTLRQRNEKNSWVVAGLRRNGILAYKASLAEQKLVPLSSEEVGGSERIDVSWLRDRFLWVDKNLVPLKPDFSLITASKELADLYEWDFHNPASAPEEDKALMDISELPSELQLPCIESGLLRLPLELQLAAQRRSISTPVSVKDKKASRRYAKMVKSLAKKRVSAKLRKALRDKLKTQSLGQTLGKLVPRAGEASEAISQKKKKLQKLKVKKTADGKALMKALTMNAAEALALQNSDVEAEEATLAEVTKGPLAGRVCRVLQLGVHCGKEATCSHHNLSKGTVTLPCLGDSMATLTLPDSLVVEKEASWLKPLSWKHMRLSRELKQRVLHSCGGSQLFLEESVYGPEPIELLKTPPQMLLDQHILYGFELLRWHFSQGSENFFFEQGIRIMDPKLSLQYITKECFDVSIVENALKREGELFKTLFVPVWGQGDGPKHWTLLHLDQESDEVRIKYYDSLNDEEPRPCCAANAQVLLDFLFPGKTLPQREDSQRQKSDECGFYVLAHIFEVVALKRGEGPASRGWSSVIVMDLMNFLRTWLGQLSGEQDKLQNEQASRLKSLEKSRLKNLKVSQELAKKASVAAEAASQAAKLAAKVLSLGKEPELSDLPKEHQDKISQIRLFGCSVCSRCRWVSGCLSCDGPKAERYYLNQLRHSLGLPLLK
ncbi:unnamed protein product [Symbiodinium natans]|uniref:Ubiquitin-like protease family profile domain-containing protein n=1 Tax=Symbiodinium natans TaxID=878477 RepID=A0A812M380_9DINO|nr:unnamed protein product [Symbiodinium natans]